MRLDLNYVLNRTGMTFEEVKCEAQKPNQRQNKTKLCGRQYLQDTQFRVQLCNYDYVSAKQVNTSFPFDSRRAKMKIKSLRIFASQNVQ